MCESRKLIEGVQFYYIHLGIKIYCQYFLDGLEWYCIYCEYYENSFNKIWFAIFLLML